MRTHYFLPVIIILTASYIGLHFYAARWLSANFSMSRAAVFWLRPALLAAAFLSPFIMFTKRWHYSPLPEVFYTAGYTWMGMILLAAFVFACSDLAVLCLRRASWFQPRLSAPATVVLLAVVTAWGVYGGQKIPGIKEITVPFKDLPPALEGFRIAQISDMHIDSGWKLRRFSGIVDRINSAKPDLVLVTGDLIDPGITCAEDLGGLIAKIKSRLGLFGSLGNHEYYHGLDRSIDCYKAFGIKLLKNDAYDFKDLRLIGLADVHTEPLAPEDVTRLLGKYRDGKFTVLMTHQPVYYPDIAAAGDYMVFSGHTHKGQIFPFHIFTRMIYRYFYALYRINNSAFYVTSGSGTWGPPLRWLAPAEIPVITLTREVKG